MAQLSSGRALQLAVIVAAVGSSIAVAAAPARAEADLNGTWHVLVHYKDDVSANPDTPRWDDRLWSFDPSGSRVRWMEWPIIVFNDDTGRFERQKTGQYARILHYWEPDQGQLGNIRNGLSVNERGSKTKTLRKDGNDWRSSGGGRARSAMTITYQENWIVENPSGLPVFIREELMGTAGTASVEGRTEYRTEEILAGGDVLVGTYQRDGTRHGTFRMTRAGARKKLEERSQKEREEEAFRRLATTDGVARQEIREDLKKALQARGVSVEGERLDELVDEWIRLFQSGVRADEIGEQLIEQELQKERDAP